MTWRVFTKKKRPHANAGRFFRVVYNPTLPQEPQALRAPPALPEPPELPQGPEPEQVQVPEQWSQPAFALPPSCSQRLQTITS